eukprot:2208509-Prorocentrum_lima.AAC.1
MQISTLSTFPMDLPACGLVGVTDVSLGGVDLFGQATKDESKTVKVYSQAGTIVLLGKKTLVEGSRG